MCVCVCVSVCDVLTQLYTSLMRDCLSVSQLSVQRSASMAAACLLIHASVSPDGADWTAPVVSELYPSKPKFRPLDSYIPYWLSQSVSP